MTGLRWRPGACEQVGVLYPAPLSSNEIHRFQRQFQRLQSGGLVLHYGRITIDQSDPDARPKIGFVLRRRNGGAVVRNRCKRVLRHRLAELDLPSGMRILAGVQREVRLDESTVQALADNLHKELIRLCRRPEEKVRWLES